MRNNYVNMQLYVHVQYVARQHVYLDILVGSDSLHILLFFPLKFTRLLFW